MAAVKERSQVGAPSTDESALRAVAIKRLKKKRDFKGHVFVYGVVNAALWTIWAINGATDEFVWPWPVIVTFFWGLFVLGDASETFWKKPISEQEIEQEIARIRGSVPELGSHDRHS